MRSIPDDRMKAEEEHTVPFSDAAMETLMSLRTDATKPDDYVFAQFSAPVPETGFAEASRVDGSVGQPL
jgi:hypothetical protein